VIEFLKSLLFSVGVVVGAITLWGLYYTYWTRRFRRKAEPGFDYVYVNQDGTARELSPEEQKYVVEKFSPADGARPYFKTNYESRDGWGSLSGFIERRLVPAGISILSVCSDFDAKYAAAQLDFIEIERGSGHVITKNGDGSVTSSPDPSLSKAESYARARKFHLDYQRRLEALAKST